MTLQKAFCLVAGDSVLGGRHRKKLHDCSKGSRKGGGELFHLLSILHMIYSGAAMKQCMPRNPKSFEHAKFSCTVACKIGFTPCPLKKLCAQIILITFQIAFSNTFNATDYNSVIILSSELTSLPDSAFIGYSEVKNPILSKFSPSSFLNKRLHEISLGATRYSQVLISNVRNGD